MPSVRIYADKKAARRELLARRNAAQSVGKALADHLRAVLFGSLSAPAPVLSALSRAQTIGLYWPLGSEPDLRGVFIEWAVRANKQLSLPFAGADRTMHYRIWVPSEGTASDQSGIPSGRGAAIIPDFIAAPMVGAGLSGRRLGYGAGYFDRYVAAVRRRSPAPFFLGVVPEDALIDEALFDEWDLPMDALLTECLVRLPVDGAASAARTVREGTAAQSEKELAARQPLILV